MIAKQKIHKTGKHENGDPQERSEDFRCGRCFAWRRNTLCISSRAKRMLWQKDRLYLRRNIRVFAHIKGGGANLTFAPHGLPFRYERRLRCGCPRIAAYLKRLSRQNLAALCTTAGKNLAAVGSSHSLTETVNLGSVATAGLIGTLHIRYTSCQNHLCSTARMAAATHNTRP